MPTARRRSRAGSRGTLMCSFSGRLYSYILAFDRVIASSTREPCSGFIGSPPIEFVHQRHQVRAMDDDERELAGVRMGGRRRGAHVLLVQQRGQEKGYSAVPFRVGAVLWILK